MVTLVKQAIGDREVEKINSSDENLIIVKEDEEEAYQKISDSFGVEPVKIIHTAKEMKFNRMEFDEKLQNAELIYGYGQENIIYLINASYTRASWGIDVEDEVTNSFEKEVKGCKIKIKEYQTPESNTDRYSASFKYNGLEYFLIGTMGEEEFNNIINNLFFSR